MICGPYMAQKPGIPQLEHQSSKQKKMLHTENCADKSQEEGTNDNYQHIQRN